MTATFGTSYMDAAVFDLENVLRTAKRALVDVDFDTIVGTGFSGGIVIPALALRLRKKFVLIRKEGDDSHHGGGRLLGELGQRWIFVDDFVSGGNTRRRVISKISQAVTWNETWTVQSPVETTLVGQYMYTNNWSDEGPQFQPFESGWVL